MKLRTLGNTGLSVTPLSFGASPLGSAFHPVTEAEGIDTVRAAIDLGINLIDTSPFYGLTKSEIVLGKALKGIPREKYIMATKVGRYGREPKDFDFSAARVTHSVDESLARLGLDHVDIIQCHDIEFGSLDQVVNETLPALRKLRDTGKVRFIGVTGLPLNIYRHILDRTSLDVILSYCHYSLNDDALDSLIPYLVEQKNIGIINASPLSMGLLSNREPPEWHPATPQIRAACAKAAAHCRARGTDIAALAIQYSLANPRIATTLVGTASVENITSNVKWANQTLDPELLAEVLQILAPIHNQTWPSGRPENN